MANNLKNELDQYKKEYDFIRLKLEESEKEKN